jgi:cellulose synthase/poly-beta-1,6-N-acetylglucosamine synthase-like glycosyltransferase
MESLILISYFFSLCVLFAFGIHGLVMLYYFRKTKDVQHNDEVLPDVLPMVTIQLPFYNELYVVERLIDSVCRIKYPKDKLEIQVLDDSTDETVDIAKNLVKKYTEEGFNIKYVHRTNRQGYKAGALKYGLDFIEGEFVAIFDADFIPNEDFLLKTIPYFKNDNIGMVQTRWEHLNEEYSFLTRTQALSLDGHFVIEQQVRNKAGFFINFNGTAGIWRKATIFDAGNWQADTLTEDLDLSYRAQLKGWKFIYLNDVTSPAELPADINSLKTQQFRWTKGAVETAKKILPMVFKADLPLKIKLESLVHLSSNIVFPFIVLVALLNIPIVIIKNKFSGLDDYYSVMSIFVVASISTFLFYTFAQKEINLDWRKRLLLFPVYLAGSMGLAINNSLAVIEALFNKKSGFVRTPKFKLDATGGDWKAKKYVSKKVGGVVFIELLLALYYLAGIGVSIYFREIAAIPFQLLFLMGFGTVGYMSLKQSLSK